MSDSKKEPLYTVLAQLLAAMANCVASNNEEWLHKHSERLETLVSTHMPSGSGFDAGCPLHEDSTPDRLVFKADYHHMGENGYLRWSEHTVIVTASLAFGFQLRVTGRDYRDIKDYISETFHHALSEVVDQH